MNIWKWQIEEIFQALWFKNVWNFSKSTMVEKLSEFNKAENERPLSVVLWKRSLVYAKIVVNNWIQFSVSVAEIDMKYGWTLAERLT